MLIAQKPEATAVLEIERWNRGFGRWVNKGSTGIALFDKDYPGRTRLKYVFDISDTHESRYAKTVPLWEMHRNYETEVTETLENNFGELEDKSSFAYVLLSAASNAVEDNMADYLEELNYYKENSFFEDLDDDNRKVIFRELLKNSVGYMLLARCDQDPRIFFNEDDFRNIINFNTADTFNALGTATSDISQMCLDAISKTVLDIQRHPERENHTFESTFNIEYL